MLFNYNKHTKTKTNVYNYKWNILTTYERWNILFMLLKLSFNTNQTKPILEKSQQKQN